MNFPTTLIRWLLILSLALASGFATAQTPNPTVTFKTDNGSFTLELFADKAPKTVENFLSYCNDQFYVGTIFHRVIPGFVVQGGGLTFDYTRKDVKEAVINESANGLKNKRGTVAMARRADPDSATSQFFVNLRHNRHLNAKKNAAGYTVFGQVIDGMDTIESITEEPIGKYRPEAPDLPVRILSVTVHPVP